MLQLELLWKSATLLSESIGLDEEIPSPPKIEDDNGQPPSEEPQDEETKFLPSTLLSLPILTRATHINDTPSQELNTNLLQSEICAQSSNPHYNFSNTFNYDHIQQLCNDFLLSDACQCNIFIKDPNTQKKGKKDTNDDDTIFGVIQLQWKQWILSAISSDQSTNWVFCLPVLDPQNDTRKRGEIHLEITFRVQSLQNENPTNNAKEEVSWKSVTLTELIPQKHSYLIIKGNNIKCIPNEWYSTVDADTKHFISISFNVCCGDDYSEAIVMDIPLEIKDENDQKDDALLDKEWIFFVDEYGLKYYQNQAQNKKSFEIQFDHIITEQDKKKKTIKTVKDKYCLSFKLRPFTRPGTCALSQTEYAMDWRANEDTEQDTSNKQSMVEIELRFKDPLITPYVKAMPVASDLLKESEIRNNHQNIKENQSQINSKVKFQAIIATIQEELKNKYLKLCTTYNDMTRGKRKETFMNYLMSSTHGQRLTQIISQIIAAVVDDEMYSEPQVTIEELTMKLRAKLDRACKPVFDDITRDINPKRVKQDTGIKPIIENEIKAYLSSTNIDNIYAEPLRDMDTIKTLIAIAFLNEDYPNAHKWITQAMAICTDKDLYCQLYMKLAFVLSQMKTDISMAYHCLNQSLSMKESKDTLYAKVLVLCENDKLEEAEPFMDQLMDTFADDPYVQTLKGIFEYLMEEVEDSDRIWKAQLDAIQTRKQQIMDRKNEDREDEKESDLEYILNGVPHQATDDKDSMKDANEYDLYDLWIFALQIALKFDCQRMIQTILTVSKPLFAMNEEYKIDFVLLRHHALVYNQEYETALTKLGEAILINDHNTKLWLHIGCTYYLLHKWNDSMEAFQRHIDECADQQISPNFMAMIRLIQIYLMCNQNDNSDESYLSTAASLIKMCRSRIESCELYDEDGINLLVSFQIRDRWFMDALKYKLWTIQAQYFKSVNDTPSALTCYAHASNIHAFDKKLWAKIDGICDPLK